ncbi:EF-hand domain-containing protein [uncultured Desulfosarcina sp.]|uniref:EF-hand domain-containing protein n=1 Tax=uncultured Desulfosarcina sp. TaxID=218289 RepID=UPI0029C7286B|nr:EF-hand domain-containing protein [uncultured Desulfosarcina sp.]
MMVSSVGSDPYSMRQMAPVGNRPGPSDMFDEIDKDGSGSVEEEEAETLAEMISEATGEDVSASDLMAYDEDGDGVLSEEETQAALEDYRPEGPPPDGMMARGDFDMSQLFSDTDEDEDGYLDETEAETIAEMISNATGEEITAESLIETYDEDGDGVLSEDETEAALEANRPEGPPPGGMMFGNVDEDEDETEAETLAEMISNATGEEITVESLIEAYDEDGDGALSEEETQAALEANRPEGPPPPPKMEKGGQQNVSWQAAAGIESYMTMADLGMNQDQSFVSSAMIGGNSAFQSSGTLMSVNTRV